MTDYGPQGYAGWWLCEAKSFDPAAPVIAGKHFEMDFHCMAVGDVTLTLRAFDEAEVDRVVIHQLIPEPVSMVLLGLGGLLLRRRR
ncbi:MAG: PEP-CTERM sorting domain-containing protein, partial [Planctomycetota bacterium]|nr:PEP-CTERM sorting domain-containing protein [Planctomycetota bacterium]